MGETRRGMQKALGGLENLVFLCLAHVLLLSATAAALLRIHLHLANARLQFGVQHLPGALLAASLFTVAVGPVRVALVRVVPVRWKGLADLPTGYYLLLITVVFCVFWLPALLAGGFDEDDWMLLAAASIRKVIVAYPSYSWHTLDAVDGNFRPLRTVLYFGYFYRWFGLWAGPYLAGLFAVNLLGCLIAFFIARAMGYSKVAGAAAALLYLSRSLTYPIETWPAALGDGLVILLCGLMALAILKAMARRGWAAAGLHLLAWVCFCLATLAKQSAFAAPLIVGLLLFLRPGQMDFGLLQHRTRAGLLGLAGYAATGGGVFIHAKALLGGKPPPYPIEFSVEALLRLFAYPVWYLVTFEFPTKIAVLRWAPSLAGAALVVGVVVLLRVKPQLLGERPRDVIFCLLAAVASLSLFGVVPSRVAPYYASMAAFWMSLALGIVLSRAGGSREGPVAARICGLVFCMLLVTGFLDVRLKQTGLLPSGGYTWATFTSSFHTRMYKEIADALAAAPRSEVLVLADMPGYSSYYAAMALLAEPRLRTILVYRSSTQSYFVNDLHGARPLDGYQALNDADAYNWTVPLDAREVASLVRCRNVLWLTFREGTIVRGL